MEKFIETGDKLVVSINRILYGFSMLMLVGMVMNVVLAVIFNKVLSKAFPIPVDYTAYMLLVAAACGYAGYQYKNGFVRVTMMTDMFPPAGKRIVEIGNFLVLILFYFFLAYQCFLAAGNAMASGQTMMSISWKIYPYYFILAGGIMWTALVTVFQMIRYIVTGQAAGRND